MCDIVLRHPSVSKLHAHFHIGGGRLELVDLDSQNGTRVNGRTLAPNQAMQVSKGDILLFGSSNTVSYVQSDHHRHGSGPFIRELNSSSRSDNNVIYRNLAFKHGRQQPDDAKVLRYTADSAPIGSGQDGSGGGGGESDGMGNSRTCSDNAPVGTPGANLCDNNVFQENIIWQTTDDGIDQSSNHSQVIGNIVVEVGPMGSRGIKGLGPVLSSTFSGNVILGWRGATLPLVSIQAMGAEIQSVAGNTVNMIHNIATRNDVYGIFISDGATAGGCTNNVAWNNNPRTIGDIGCATGMPLHTNFSGDVSGTDPTLVNPNFDPTTILAAAEGSSGFPAVTIASRWQTLYSAFQAQFKPAPGSPLIDAGTLISGYHCPIADDHGQDPTARCRHWKGLAPDIGPFELGITGNPDLTAFDGHSVVLTTQPTPTLSSAPSGLQVR